MLIAGVQAPHAVVALGGEIEQPICPGDAFTAAELRRKGHLLAGAHGGSGRVRHVVPDHLPDAFCRNDFRHLQGAGREVGQRSGGNEAVESAIGLVFGEIEVTMHRVDSHGFVLEQAQRGTRLGRFHAKGVALPHQAALHFFAGQPGLPRRLAAGTIVVGAGKNRVGVHNLAAGTEAHRAHAAPAFFRFHFTVGDIDPPAIRRGKGGATIGRRMQAERRRRQHRLAGAGNDARLHARQQTQAVGVRLAQRAKRLRSGEQGQCVILGSQHC